MKLLFATILALAAIFTAAPASADPAPGPCLTPTGAPCAPDAPGCVQPDNNLPCSSSLPDINSAIRRELQQVLGGFSPPR